MSTVLLGEVGKGEGGEDLEEAGVVWECARCDEALGRGVDLEVEAGEVVVGDLDAVDLDALVDAGEVGRSVEGGAVAGGREDARERGGGGALAVGSGDQDGREGESADRRGPRRGRACGRGRTCGAAWTESAGGAARGRGRRDGRPLRCRTWRYFRRLMGFAESECDEGGSDYATKVVWSKRKWDGWGTRVST